MTVEPWSPLSSFVVSERFGDYYAFLTPDLEEGTFGHPWEQTLCVIGRRMVDSLGRSLGTWLPVKRENGGRM